MRSLTGMCGISGVLGLEGAPVERWRIERMNRALVHRGPDGCGIFVGGEIALGHRRLSIVDVAGGHQPMASDDESVWITFNGEIFNYIELREELRARGHRFSTESDTEVILHLYQEYGEDFVTRMNGEWALAVWDVRRRQLLLSRDRFGIRPLFYVVVDGRLTFGSEIKALLQDPMVPRVVDLETLDQIFTFWSPLAPRTFFKGINDLPPGHSLIVSDGRLRKVCYWRPEDFVGEATDVGDERAAADQLLELLVDATRIRLRADVPVGAYLSGGLDSSVTAAIAAGCASPPIRTFSVRFDDLAFDEGSFQEQAVKRLGSEHHACHCSEAAIAQIFPDVVWHTETPVLRTAPAPLFLLSRHVREHGFRVVVTGEGADETLAGYDIYKEAKIRRFWSLFPDSLRRPLLLRRLYPYMDMLQSQPLPYLQAFFCVTPDDVHSPFFSHLPRWRLTAGLKRFYSADLRTQLDRVDPIAALRARLPAEFDKWDGLSRAQYLEMTCLLPGYILSSQGDRMSMAHGVEGRLPFLDHRLVEFAARLPSRFKMRGLNEKAILKRATGHLVPAAIAKRKKQPYRAPDARCFFGQGRGLAEPGYVSDLLAPQRLAQDGLFNPSAVQLLVAKARSGQPLGVKDNMSLIGILSTQLLVDQFVRTPPNARH